MSKHQGERRARELITEAGLQVVSIEQRHGGGHLKAVVRAPDGREERRVLPLTCSDHRATKNALADLRRFARGFSTKQKRTQ